MADGSAFYAKHGNTYCIRLVGEIRYTMGYSLDDFLDRLFERRDFDDIVVDLTEASFIDSTNLGLLAKIANFLRKCFHRKMTLVSPNEEINQMLENVGFTDIFHIRHDREVGVEGERKLAIEEPDKAELTQTVVSSHDILCEVNEKSRATFRDVRDMLKEHTSTKI
jgi:anti-anti-sigma factor